VYSKNHNQTLNTTSQEPAYLIEQRKNIVGLWINEYDSKDRIEFKSNGTGLIRYASEPTENFNYQIVNTTPQCGYQFTQDHLKSLSFLQTYEPGDAANMECKEIKFLSQERLIYVSVGDNPENRVIYIKSKIVLDKVKE
jgi:hypothetical protein